MIRQLFRQKMSQAQYNKALNLVTLQVARTLFDCICISLTHYTAYLTFVSADADTNQPFDESSVVGNTRVLDKLYRNADYPTVEWATARTDGSCCLLQLPRVESDGPSACRYRCSTCFQKALNNRDDRLPGRILRSNQLNGACKHLCSDIHYNAHMSLHPVSSEEKRRRVLHVIPKLYDILSRKKPAEGKKPADKRYFTIANVAALEHQLAVNIDVAYRKAFVYGMQGCIRNAVTVEEPAAQQAQHPQSDHTPQAPPESQFYSSSMPVTMDFAQRRQKHPPNLLINNDLQRMYQSTQEQSAQFHSFQRPKS